MRVFNAIFREILTQFIVQVSVISSIIIVLQMTRQAEDIFSLGISLENILTPFFLVFLPFAGYIIPIAFLFACMVAFLRLSGDQELTALRAAGMSLWRVSIPVVVLGTLLSILGTVSSTHLDPWSRVQFQKFFFQQAQTKLDKFLKVQLQPKVFSDGFFGISFYAEEVNEEHTRFKKIILGPLKNKATTQVSIYAKSAELTGSVDRGNLTLNLYDGVSHHYTQNKDQSIVTEFSSTEIDLLSLFKDSYIKPKFSEDDFQYFIPTRLRAFYRFQENKLDALRSTSSTQSPEFKKTFKNYNESKTLFYHRFSISLCVIALGLLGMVFGIQGQRNAKNLAYVHTLLAFVLSFGLIMFFKQLGSKGSIPAPLAAVTPIVLIYGVAIYFLYLKNNKPPSEPILSMK